MTLSNDEIATLFILAAAHKAKGEFDKVDEAFLATVASGVPQGVKVVYLFADRDAPPISIEDAYHFDVFVLEFEGQEGQAMPVPLLIELDPQLATSLFVAAKFQPRQDLEPVNEELYVDLPRFDGDLGDNDPPV